MNFNLAAPKMLWLVLLVVPPLIFFLWWAWRKRQELITQFISARLLGALKVGVSPSRQKWRMVLLVAAVTCLTLSLARPQWGYSWEEAKQRGLDIIVAIDTSNSMLAEDVPPNRLARAKLAALDLMRHAKTDRLGLIAFAGDAFLTCPLTLDDAAFGQSVDALDTHAISQGGTAVAEAINTAREAFKEEAENHKALVIFTDGEDHDGGAVKAAETAAKEGMRIYTIGIGSPDGELLRIRDEHGRTDYIRDDDGNPVKSKLNETLLGQIASAAGGFYLPLRGTTTMDTLYDHPRGLGSLPKATNSSKLLRQYHERYHWPVAFAIILLIVEMFLPDRKLRRAQSAASSGSLAQAAEAAAVILLIVLPMTALAGPGRAQRDYDQGRYQDALKDYQELLDAKKDDPRLHFNAGAAAYQGRQLDEAAKQFNDALISPDLQLQERAYYNLGNTYFRMGQRPPPGGAGGMVPAGQDLEATKKNWEQALQHYESALKLNPLDDDAKFNRGLVQRRLEELKKQQQQQQQNQSNKSDDKQDQNKNQQNQQSKNDQNKDKQQQQQQQDQKQDSQANSGQKQDNQKPDQKQEQSAEQKQQDQQSQAQQQKDQQKKDQQARNQANQDQDQSKEEAEREAAMMAAGQMTPQQAQQLLDAQKGDEQVLKLAPPEKHNSQGRPFKNW
jgi:Ca-activated chloride channel family protein